MEEHFLNHLVAGENREPSRPWYNAAGDCIVYQMADEAIVADRIDEVLTIYRSAITDKPIGYEIKGVMALTRRFGWEGILVKSQHDAGELKAVSLSALLLVAYEQGPKTMRRRRAYADAFDSCAGQSRLRAEDLECMVAQ
jgi:hypothetical protein